MNLNLSDCRTSFSFVTKGKEQPDGETKHLKCTVTADISVPTLFLDEWLDGHLSGAQPRDVLWRLTDPENPTTSNRFPRYMSIEQLKLSVSKDRLYAFKFRAPTPHDWDGPEREFYGYREYAFMGVKVKAAKLTPGPNGGLARLVFVLEQLPPEAVRDVADLSLLEEVLCDAWCLQADVVEQSGKAAEGDGDDAGDESGEHPTGDEEAPE